MKTKEEALEMILENTYSVDVNMNDTFGYACAESEELDGNDLIDLVPFVQSYGYGAVIALVSIKREIYEDCISHPIKPLDTKDYRKAREEILADIKDKERETFLEIRWEFNKILEQLEKYGERVKYAGSSIKKGSIPQIQYLEKAQIYAIGLNGVNTEKDLDNKFKNRK